MSTPFILDYFRVAEDNSDRPSNPNTELAPGEPGTSPEAITFRFEKDTKTLIIWDPDTETYITVRTSEDAVDAADVDYDNSGSGLAATNVKDALDELSLTVAGNIAVEDEAVNLTSAVTKFNFAGAGVAATEPIANEILVTIPGYSDEQAQDAVGGALVDGTTVNFTYNDGANTITAEVQAIATTHFAVNVIDTDGTLAANSDTRLATQKAVKTYVTSSGAFSGARVKKAANQTTADYSSGATMAFDAEVFDVGGWHDNSANNSRLTVPTGIIRVRFTLNVHNQLGTDTQSRSLRIFKNGSTHLELFANANFYAEAIINSSTGWLDTVAGDYWELWYFSGGDNSITIIAANTFFEVEGRAT